MIRLLAAGLLLTGVSGCAGVPATVIWSTTGSVAGFGAKALDLDRAILERTGPAPAKDEIQL